MRGDANLRDAWDGDISLTLRPYDLHLWALCHSFSSIPGDPSAPSGSKGNLLYEEGVSAVGTAGIVRASLSIVIAGIYPFLLRYMNAGSILGVCHAAYGVLLLVLSGTRSKLMGEIAVAANSFPMTTLITIPVALTVERSDASNRGRYVY